ncbi:MAG: metal-sulfur cluster assembly factor [Leptospiraceae bacterium]|nr:metal-sulfur cluster assembly factor [Leptospiraceae bacterium]
MSDLEKQAWESIKQVIDPELGISIIDLGLVYDVKVVEKTLNVKMTLTSMGCPAGPMIKNDVILSCANLEEIEDVEVEFVWTPRWDPSIMASEEAQMELGIY